MGIILGVISAIFILSAIYFRVDNRKKLSNVLFVIGIFGALLFVVILMMAIFD